MIIESFVKFCYAAENSKEGKFVMHIPVKDLWETADMGARAAVPLYYFTAAMALLGIIAYVQSTMYVVILVIAFVASIALYYMVIRITIFVFYGGLLAFLYLMIRAYVLTKRICGHIFN